jgi:hypothetical protein
LELKFRQHSGEKEPDAEIYYSLRPIILFANADVSRHILVIDTSVFVKSNMGRREYSSPYSIYEPTLQTYYFKDVEIWELPFVTV